MAPAALPLHHGKHPTSTPNPITPTNQPNRQAYRPFYNLLLAFYTMMDMFWLGWDGTDPAYFSAVLNDYAELVILEGLHGFGAFAELGGAGFWDGFEDEDMDGFDEFDEFEDDYR